MATAGMFHYLPKEQVKVLVFEIESRFSGAGLLFDTVGTFEHKLMMKKVLNDFRITDINGYFPPATFFKNLTKTTDKPL